MQEASGWVAEQVGPAPVSAGRAHTLVVCRSRATASLVRRWLASEGGRLGVEVALPSSVAAQLVPRPLLAPAVEADTEDPLLPLDSEMGGRVAGRPGLTAVARRWVQHVRLARAGRMEVSPPAWIEELLERGWAHDPDHAAWVELLGSGAVAKAAWDRVVAVGFWDEPGVASPAEDGVVRSLCGSLPPPPAEWGDPLPSVRVPDVTAEARLAVREAAEDPEGTLVLCAHVATARRLRDALARSGLPCAWRDTEALAAHEVASAVRRAAAWFAAGTTDPALQAEDVSFVFARIGLARLHPAVGAAIRARLAAAGVPEVHLTRARLGEVVLHSRLLDAPLSVWLDRLAGIAEGVTTVDRAVPLEKLRASAIAVRARLLVLRAAVAAVPLRRVLEEDGGAPLTFDPDDFDQVIAQLLGDDAVRGPVLPEGSTLGGLHRFLVESRVRVHDDPVAQAILGSLGRRAAWPAGPAWVHQALAGAHDPGVLGEGVDVLLADEWDGRPCRTLILLDVHDHGLGRHARPDPLLSDSELAAVGALPVGRQVERRLAQVRRAAACARRTLAIVSDRDASGREVVPPVLLALKPGKERVGSYGFGLDVPELAPLAALAVGEGAAVPPDHADWQVRHLATQATAEWVREGRGPRVALPASLPDRPSLADQLRAESPIAPPWVLPYVGDASGVPEAGLPDKPLSVSGYLGHLAKCGFRAFATTVLRLAEEEELRSELDAREVGNAVHAALEQAAPSLAWRSMDADGRVRALASLREATRVAFAEAVAKLGSLSASRRAASDGLRERWDVHWEAYVASRSLPPSLKGFHADVLRDHPDVIAASALFVERVRDAAKVPWWLVRLWLLEHAGERPDAVDEASLLQANGKSLACSGDDLRVLLDHPSIADLGRTLYRLRLGEELMTGHVVRQVVATELSFGDSEAEATEVITAQGLVSVRLPETSLQLGRAPLNVRGRIDRIEWITTEHGQGVVVTDFKSGTRRKEGRMFRWDVLGGRDPQLLVYAMVLERAQRDGLLPESLRMPVAIVANDHVWMTRSAGDGPIETTLEQPDTYLPVEIRWLGSVAGILGELVDHTRDGRWLLRPREDSCPKLSTFAFGCPGAVACRFRGLPAPDDGEDDDVVEAM
jgi:RecB family exonuclease